MGVTRVVAASECCVCELQIKHIWKAMAAIRILRVLPLFLSPFVSARTCNTSDIVSGFGECPEHGGSRNVYHYQNSERCDFNSSLVLPPPRKISCQISCPAGSILSTNSTGDPECQLCAAGEYSLGGGFEISGERNGWKLEKWPAALETWCIGRRGYHWVLRANGCHQWKPDENGTIIYSGDNNNKHNIMSALRLVVVLKKPGYVSFRYQVEAEQGRDGLEFTINSIIKMGFQSNQPTWKKRVFPLPAGSHVLEWFYWKNWYGDYGDDRAKLEIIEVAGTDFAELGCTKCPQGTSSVPGSAACVTCAANEYASDEHYGQCVPCPPNTYSFPGAVHRDACKVRLPCVVEDYSKNYTECNTALNRRDLFYNWTLPHICNETTGVSLPSLEVSVDCEPCQPGMYKDASNVCHECGPGRYLPQGLQSESGCATCERGSESIEEVYYEYFYKWPQGFSSNGWVLHEDYAYAGGPTDAYENRAPAMQLTLDSTFFQDGAVNFTYEAINTGMGYDPTKDSFDFFVDGVPKGQITASQGLYTVAIGGISPGSHTLLWNVRGTNIIRIHRVILIGVRGGGATACAPCRAGFQSSQNRESCEPCMPGFTSNDGSDCTPCPANTYAASTTTCLACGEGTTSAAGSTHCTPLDILDTSSTAAAAPSSTTTGRQYNISSLLVAFGSPHSKHANSSMGVEIDLGGRTFAFALSRRWGVARTGGSLITEKVVENEQIANTEVRAAGLAGQNCSVLPEYTYFSAGSELSLSPMKVDDAMAAASPNPSRGGGLILSLARGDVCGEAAGSGDTAQPGQMRWSAQVQVVCDLDAEDIYSTVTHLNAANSSFSSNVSCHGAVFEMASKFACPICSEGDFEAAYSSCHNGKKTVTWYRKVACLGSKDAEETQCHMKFSATVIGLMAAGIIIALIIAVALVYYLVRLRKRFQDVHNKYVLLRDGYNKNSFNLAPAGHYNDFGELDGDGSVVEEKSEAAEQNAGDGAENKGGGLEEIIAGGDDETAMEEPEV